MNYIIEIDKLEKENIIIGYIGIEYKTWKIKYYTHYDEFGIYNCDMLYELDMNNPNVKMWYLDNFGNIKRDKKQDLSSELQLLLDSLLKKHLNFNIKYGHSTKMLEDNMKYLSIQYDRWLSFSDYVATYTPLSNIIKLSFNKNEWNLFTESQKKEYEWALLHEIGHMKSSSFILDETINQAQIKTGFGTSIDTFSPLQLDNGDIFLILRKHLTLASEHDRILEEVMNCYECKIIDPYYVPSYPDFGRQLDELCDGRLLPARYTNGIEEYYSSLTKIINSKDLADELLERIKDTSDSIEENEYKTNEKKVLELINKYYKAKTR